MGSDRAKQESIGHTPGPWRRNANTGWISTAGDPYGHGPMHIADMRGWGHLTGGGACNFHPEKAALIQDANAALLVAAPDLLEACKAIMALHQGQPSGVGNWDVAFRMVQRAIERAEGR